VVTLVVSPAITSSGDRYRVSEFSVADCDTAVGASNGTRKPSYQLQQYINSPSTDDPYFACHRDRHGATSVIVKLDLALSLLQTSGQASKS
jgi:hypothetical protein